jgi:hypothetical protein
MSGGKPDKEPKKKPADKHAELMTDLLARHSLIKPRYLDVRNSVIENLYCKKCGELIAGLTAVDNGRKLRMERGQTIIETKVAFGALANYRTILIECDDGSAHETTVCSTCLPGLTVDDLNDFLTADTEETLQEGVRSGRPLKEEHLEKWVSRAAIRIAK